MRKFVSKLKSKFIGTKSGKRIVSALTVSAVAMSTCVATFAEDTTTTAMGTAMGTVKSDAISAIGTVAPYGIAIMGSFLVWRLGVKFFKSLAK